MAWFQCFQLIQFKRQRDRHTMITKINNLLTAKGTAYGKELRKEW